MDSTALLMTLAAGLATPLGGVLALLRRGKDRRLQALGMGLSAGVLIYLALQGLLGESAESLESIYHHAGHPIALGAFACGMLLMMLLDHLLPGSLHSRPARHHYSDPQHTSGTYDRALLMSGITTAVAISIHNIPEGVMLYVTATQSYVQALPVLLAVAIHNLPIGLSIAIPIYYATGRRSTALLVCLLSGLMEVIGAFIGALLHGPMESPLGLGLLLAVIAGIMIYVAFDELVPAALCEGRRHTGLAGILLGLLIMGLTMALLHHH